MSEIPVTLRMLKNSRKRVFLCDGHKVGKTSVYHQCTLGDVDCVVSDAPLQDRFEAFDHLKFIKV